MHGGAICVHGGTCSAQASGTADLFVSPNEETN